MYKHICNKCGSEYYRKTEKTKGRCRPCVDSDPERRRKISSSWKNKTYKELNDIKEKKIKTNLEKYGTEFHTQAEYIKEKTKKTNLKKYGYDNPSKSPEIIQKIKDISLEKYGYDNPAKSPEIKKKISESLINSDFDRVSFMHERIKKMDEAGIERTGAVNTEKTKETNLKKYGCETFFGSEYGKMTRENLKKYHNYSDEEVDLLFKSRGITLDNMVMKYGAEEGIVRYKKWKREVANTYDNFVLRHGHEEGTRRYKEHTKNKVLFSKASKESLKFFIPLYKRLRRLGLKREDIFFGVGGSKEYFICKSLGQGKPLFRFFDFTIKSLKIIIEYHGIYFHPRENEERNWKFAFKNITYDEALQRDKEKKELAVEHGFHYIVVWSDDNLMFTTDKIISIVEERLK